MIGNQVVSTMYDIKSSIHMAIFVPHWDWDEEPGLIIHYVFAFPRLQRRSFDHVDIYIYIYIT
jgi:hypothetical protein